MARISTSEEPTFSPPATLPPPPPSGPPTAILAWSHSGGCLLDRQTQAVADYWSALAHAMRPNQAMTAGLGLWGRLLDDYAAAWSEAAAPFRAPTRPHPERFAAE